MTTTTAPRHAVDGSPECTTRLLSYGFSREEIRDPDRLPEQLILSFLVGKPSAPCELKSQRWWQARPRRLDLAFERLRATGQIEFGAGGLWRSVSGETAEPVPPKKPVQRSLF